jgi:glycosyltransferase involved in cell wall biosynthesis
MAPPRRVLHVCDFHLKYATGLARGMADRGCRVKLLTRGHDLEFGGEPGAMRSFVEQTAGPRVEHHMLPGRVRDPAQLGVLRALRRLLRGFSAEAVHLQAGVTNDVRLLVAAGVRPRRYALTVHDLTLHPGDRGSLPHRIGERPLLRGAGLVFVHSETLREELLARAGTLPPVEVVPHGIAVPRPSPLPERPALLFFGRISTWYKGVDVLLDAMPAIWERVPETTLTIAGAGEIDDHPTLEDARVVLRNEHVPEDDLAGLFAAATCCVLPYREASQSGVGSRAKSYGRPIVASDTGGLPELVTPNSGRLVPPGDPVALANAIVEVLSSPGLAEAMSRASAEWVKEAGWNRVAELTLEAYARHLGQ